VLAVHTHPYAGHSGINLTLKKAQQVYYWPQMRQTVQVETVVKECDSCQRVQYVRHKSHSELHPLQTPERRWRSVSMNMITDLPVTKRGHDAGVVFVDRLRKMVHVAPCTKQATAERLAEIFEHELFKHHGMPTDILSDRDIRFQSEFWKTVHSRLGVKLSMSRHRSTAKHCAHGFRSIPRWEQGQEHSQHRRRSSFASVSRIQSERVSCLKGGESHIMLLGAQDREYWMIWSFTTDTHEGPYSSTTSTCGLTRFAYCMTMLFIYI
jgi:hypothetical protein